MSEKLRPTWRLLECSKSGSRWGQSSSLLENLERPTQNGEKCNFSECSCQGTGKVQVKYTNANLVEASNWFRRR